MLLHLRADDERGGGDDPDREHGGQERQPAPAAQRERLELERIVVVVPRECVIRVSSCHVQDSYS